MNRTPTITVLAVGALVLVVGSLALVGSARSNDPAFEKQEIVDRVAATHAAALQYAQEHPEDIPIPNPTTMPTIQPMSWSVGIVDEVVPPVSSMTFLSKNAWSWDINGYHIGVHAGSEGSEGDNPGRGVLMVLATTMDLKGVPSLTSWHEAPIGVGALKVVDFDGTVLRIEAETGQMFYFDAETRAFTDANGDPVPTDTPTPSPWPSPTLPPVTIPPPPTEPPETASAVPAP